MKKCNFGDHHKESNTKHIELLFKEILKNKEETCTKQNLFEDKLKKDLLTIRAELSETKEQLCVTTKIAEETKKSLETAQKSLKETEIRLLRTEQELKISIDGNKEEIERKFDDVVNLNHVAIERISKVLLCERETEAVDDVILRLMAGKEIDPYKQLEPIRTGGNIIVEFTHFNQLLIQRMLYEEKLQHVFESVENGVVQHISEKECFFKLRLEKNNQFFFIDYCDDVKGFRNTKTVFTNDVICLNNVALYWCDLYVNIENYGTDNSDCFLIDTKKSGKNRLLKFSYSYGFGDNEQIDWEVYENNQEESLFYFKKK